MQSVILSLIRRNAALYSFLFNARAFVYSSFGMVTGRKAAREHFLSTAALIKHSTRIAGMPVNITIEPSNFCTLKCPACETGTGELGRVKKAMSLDQFKSIVDRIADHTNTLIFYFMGEPFLNKDSYGMIRYAKEKGIPFVTTCTNGECVDPELLVQSGIDEINFQIAGLTPETHRIYRIGGDLAKTIDNLKGVVRAKKRYNSHISVTCGFIVMKQNEHELSRLGKFKSDTGVDAISVISPCVRSIKQANEYLPADESFWLYDKRSYKKLDQLKPKSALLKGCPWIHYSLVILASGDVVPCCRDAKGEYVMGNILQDELRTIWNNAKFTEFRHALQASASRPSLCLLCSGFGLARLR